MINVGVARRLFVIWLVNLWRRFRWSGIPLSACGICGELWPERDMRTGRFGKMLCGPCQDFVTDIGRLHWHLKANSVK
jgi:formylmethanofuran dehydrogenase subunit E